MHNLLNHLKFLLTATNQHGVHSPFIYDYVTKCLYTKLRYSQQKSQNILLKSIAYFGAEHAWLLTGKDSIEKEIKHTFSSVQFKNGPYDIVLANPSEAKTLVGRASEENKIHNNTLLLIDGIHANTTHLSHWENIKNHQTVTVTVDMFYCGAVFFRNEQAKEHFKIRI